MKTNLMLCRLNVLALEALLSLQSRAAGNTGSAYFWAACAALSAFGLLADLHTEETAND